MMISARGNKRCFAPKALGQLQAEHAAIKPKRALKVSDLEMHMADANFRINCLHSAVRSAFYPWSIKLLLFSRACNRKV
jgi:hypothetical protein